MDYRVYDFVTDLRSYTSSDQAWDATVKFFRADGFLMATHGYLPNAAAEPHSPQDTVDITTAAAPMRFDASKPTKDFYFHHGYRHDPILYKPSVGFAPYFSGPDFTTRDQFGDKYFAIMNEVRALGLNGGFVVPLIDHDTGLVGRFAIGTPLAKKEVESLMRERTEIYQIIMLLADEYIRALPCNAEIAAAGLSPRETECLMWLAQGDRVDRIADRLCITNSTVNLHFSNVKKKLNATTREQALVKAIFYGIISP